MGPLLWIAVSLCGLCLLLLLLYLLLLIRPRAKQPQSSALLCKYAHRGLHGRGIPENSRAAFDLACQKGFGIELDVQLSRDGEVMVFHDYTLDRVVGREGKLCDLCAAERITADHNNRPAVFYLGFKFFTVQIFCKVVTVKRQIYFPFEFVAQTHKKLMVRLDVILSYFTDCHTTGKGTALSYRQIRREINRISVIHHHIVSFIISKCVIEKVENCFVDFLFFILYVPSA